MAADMLERIAKLLNQAENAGNEAEADAFMERAQALASTHSVDLAKARHATIAKQRTIPVQRTIRTAERGTKGLRTITDLYLGIAAANDIECTISHDATLVYAHGFAEDIDVSEAMFASLQVQMAKAAEEFKRAGTWKNEKVWRESKDGWFGVGEYKPQTWLTARLEFQHAFAMRIGTRLIEAKREAERKLIDADAERASRPHIDGDDVSEHFKQWFYDNHGLNLDEDNSTAQEMRHGFINLHRSDGPEGLGMWLVGMLTEYIEVCEAQGSNGSGTELVLVEKRDAVNEFFAPYRRAARGSYRGGHGGGRSAAGQSAGRVAADRAKLGGSTAIGGVRGAIGA